MYVQPSFIRVDADEVTYPLHIILRSEIEDAIISDSGINVLDLPVIWKQKMDKYLGVVPDTDTDGCLQDIHWPSGAVGYFPSYTMGAVIAAMMMNKAKSSKYPNTDTNVYDGRFENLNSFLNNNLRLYGSSLSSSSLLYESTGHKTIQPRIFVEYLRKKYLE